MGLQSFALLAATFLLACFSSAPTLTVADFPTKVRKVTEEQDEASTQMRSATSETMSANSEARTQPWLSAVVKYIRPASSTKQKSAHTVFTDLEVGDNVLQYLTSKRAASLVKALKRQSQTSANTRNSLIGEFMTRYGELNLAKVLYAASQSDAPRAKTVATTMLNQLHQVWLSEDKTVGAIFKMMVDSGNAYTAIASQNIKVLEGYVNAYKQRDTSVTLIDVLKEHFGGDEKFVRFLVSAKLPEAQARDGALELENLLLMHWINKGFQSENVLQLLNFQAKLDELDDPALEIVVKFVDIFNRENKGHPFSLIKAFLKENDDAAVARKLCKAGWPKYGETHLESLKTELLELWLKEKKSGDEVIELLNFKKFNSRFEKLAMLGDFISLFQAKKHLGKAPDWFKSLYTAFESDAKFALAIWAVKDTDVFKWINPYSKALFEEWMSRYEPHQVQAMFRKVRPRYATRAEVIVKEYEAYFNEQSKRVSFEYGLHFTEPRIR